MFLLRYFQTVTVYLLFIWHWSMKCISKKVRASRALELANDCIERAPWGRRHRRVCTLQTTAAGGSDTQSYATTPRRRLGGCSDRLLPTKGRLRMIEWVRLTVEIRFKIQYSTASYYERFRRKTTHTILSSNYKTRLRSIEPEEQERQTACTFACACVT